MRNLIQSLQNHNQQLKMESARYKRRLKETQAEMVKVCGCLVRAAPLVVMGVWVYMCVRVCVCVSTATGVQLP